MKRLESGRLAQLGSAIFAEVASWKEQARAKGLDVIDLGIGSPDSPPTETTIRALEQAVRNPAHYGYPSSEGSLRFRSQAADWYRYRFGVDLDPEEEIVTLMGSQDGLAHLAMAVTDPGDTAIVPDPGYPIYSAGLVLAGVRPYLLPLRQENGFLPDFAEIPEEILKQAAFMLLNYPGNPTAAVAPLSFFEEWVRFARKHDLLIVHDVAYSELAFDGFTPPSVLQVEGAKDVAVEFHSLSKSFNMAGCRIAFLSGNRDAVKALRTLKSNIDYGVFGAVQEAGISAMEEDMETGIGRRNGAEYERRRNLFLEILQGYGWDIPRSKATMFVWAPVPSGWTSRQISREMLFSSGVAVIPGDAFGPSGEGFIRIALVQEDKRLEEAARRIGTFWRDQVICEI